MKKDRRRASSRARNCRHPVGISARGFADGVSCRKVVCLDRNLSAYGLEQPLGTGNWQHRFGMDADPGVGVDDQDRDGSWIEEVGSVQAGQKPPAVNSPKQS